MKMAFSEAKVLTKEEIESIIFYTEDPKKIIAKNRITLDNLIEKIDNQIVDFLNEIVRVNNPRIRYILSEFIRDSLVLCWSKLPIEKAQEFYSQIDSLIGNAAGYEEESLLKLKCTITRIFWIESSFFNVRFQIISF